MGAPTSNMSETQQASDVKLEVATEAPLQAPPGQKSAEGHVVEWHKDAEGCNHEGVEFNTLLDSSSEFMLAQTRKGCFQEMCGCDANTQFKFIINGQHSATLDERSSCCNRFCCKGDRWWYTRMVMGNNLDAKCNDSQPALLNFYRPYRCHKSPCKCCCYQEVQVSDGAGHFLGGIKEQFWCCVPKYTIYDHMETPVYDVHMPTCVGGQCVNCCAEGCCNCRVPFYLYPPGGDDDSSLNATHCTQAEGVEGPTKAQICKIWSGLGTELFTDADKFEVKCPDGSDAAKKAQLIASTLLINQVEFERSDENAASG